MTEVSRLSIDSIQSEDMERESSDEEPQEFEYQDDDDTFDDDLWASRVTRRFTMAFPPDTWKQISKGISPRGDRLSSSPGNPKLRHSVSVHALATNIPPVQSPKVSATKPPISPRNTVISPRAPTSAPDTPTASPRSNHTPVTSPRASMPVSPRPPIPALRRENTISTPGTPITSPRANIPPLSPRTTLSIPPGTPLSPRSSVNTIPLIASSAGSGAIMSPDTIASIPPGTPLSPRTSSVDPKANRVSAPVPQCHPPPLSKSPMHVSCDSIHVPPPVARKLSAPPPPSSPGANGRLRSVSSPAAPPPPPPRSAGSRVRQQEIVQENLLNSLNPPAPPAKPAQFTFAVPLSPGVPDEAQAKCVGLKKPLPPPPVPPKKAHRLTPPALEKEKAALRIQRCYRRWHAQKRYRKLVAQYKYRSHIAKEILSTEQSYVVTLRLIMSRYYDPIINSSTSLGLEPEDTKVIFGGLEVLLNVNSRLLSSLEERMRSWSPVQCLGDLFLEMFPFLKTYTEYVKNFDLALQRLAEACKSQKFESFLRTAEECNGIRTPLEALLITPVQRIPRYVLLLQQLHEHTPETHPDFEPLQKAIVQIKDVATYINEKKRESDSALRVVQIQSLLTGKAPSIIAAQRRFCYEGELIIPSRSGKKKKKRHWFLFNDILLCTTPLYIKTLFAAAKRKFKYNFFIALHDADVIEQEDCDTGILLSTPTNLHNLYTDTPEQRPMWMEKLQAVILALRNSDRGYEERVSKISQEKAKATKAFITSQYSVMKIGAQDQYNSFPAPERKLSNPATTGMYIVAKPPPSAPRTWAYRNKVEEEPQTADEQAFTEFLTKGGQRAQFAELLKRLVGKSTTATNSPDPTTRNPQRSSAPLKMQTTDSQQLSSPPPPQQQQQQQLSSPPPQQQQQQPRQSISIIRKLSNAKPPTPTPSSTPSSSTTATSPTMLAAAISASTTAVAAAAATTVTTTVTTTITTTTTENHTQHRRKGSHDEVVAMRMATAKSIADVAALKVMMLHELSDRQRVRHA